MYVSVCYTNFRSNISLLLYLTIHVFEMSTHTRMWVLIKNPVTFSDLGQSWNDSLMGILTDNLKSCMRRDRDGEPI